MWAGTKRDGLCELKNNSVSKIYNMDNGLSSNMIKALFRSDDGSLWIGTGGGGLNRLKNDRINVYGKRDGLLSDDVNVVLVDKGGIIWVGTAKGLNRIKRGKTFSTIDEIDEFTGSSISSMYEDHTGNLWVSIGMRLFRIKKGVIRLYKPEKVDWEYKIISILESSLNPGVLWIGTNGNGLLRFEGGKFSRYTAEDGLYSNHIFSIAETGKGSYLWMSSYTGVFSVHAGELEKYSNNEIDHILASIYYTEADGMKSSVCAGGTFPSVWKAGEKLYFPTIKGISVFDTSKVMVNKHLPPVVIEEIIIDNESFKGNGDVIVSRDKHMFEFYFTALSYTSPEKIRFRYRLDGFEKKWIFTDNRQKRMALFLNLDPGKYVFRVNACNKDGIWNENGASFSFLIRSGYNFVKLVLFVLLFLVAATGVYFFWYRKNIQAKEDRKKYQTSALTPDRAEGILEKLLLLMQEEKVYLDPDLTLKKLSEKLFVHYNHLSQIINEKLNQSFNDFVNGYRIEEAKGKLKDPIERDKTILEIAYDVGFYSKSVFNTAFKKFTGETPSQFKRENLK